MKLNAINLVTIGLTMACLVACDPELEGQAGDLFDEAREGNAGAPPPMGEGAGSPMGEGAGPPPMGEGAGPMMPDGPDPEPGMDPDDEVPDTPTPGAPADPEPPAELGAACPIDVFYDMSNVAGAGAAYPMPSVEVTCTENTIDIASNGIPHYAFQAVTPNGLRVQNHQWSIPRHPVLVDEMTDVPLLGLAAISINGLSIYGPNEGPMPDPYGDPIYNDIMDWCLGHTGFNGDYHYHALLESCFFDNLDQNAPSPILGFALDGFPIYGPRGCVDADCREITTFESSWRRSGDPTTYAWDNHTCDQESCAVAEGNRLDRCNGRIGPDGTYRYHATTNFPYIVGCYHGDVSGSGELGNGAPGGQAPGGQAPGGQEPGGQNGAPPMGGPGDGPPACDVEADCDDACPADAIGCTCADSPRGSVCVPECNVDADCEDLAPVDLFCGNQGFCVPQR